MLHIRRRQRSSKNGKPKSWTELPRDLSIPEETAALSNISHLPAPRPLAIHLLHAGKTAFREPGLSSGPAWQGKSLPGCASPHAGKAASQPRPGAPDFGGTFAILKPESVDWISRSDFLLARTSARLCGLRDSAPSAHLPSRCHAPQKRPPSGSDGGAQER